MFSIISEYESKTTTKRIAYVSNRGRDVVSSRLDRDLLVLVEVDARVLKLFKINLSLS